MASSANFNCRSFLEERLRWVATHKPLVHHITNYVVKNETANVTLCLGALPVMAHALEEVEEMASQAGALVINMGTPYADLEKAMLAAGRAANRAGVPVVLDPVGAGATAYRTRLARTLVEEIRFAVVRGNAAEMAVLAGMEAEIRGVESISTGSDAEVVAGSAASRLGCVAAVTGEVDVISDGSRTLYVHNGHPMLAKVTGTGCMATTCVAVMASAGEPFLEATAAALALFGLAGERAARVAGERPGTFHVEIYNALYDLSTRLDLEGLYVS